MTPTKFKDTVKPPNHSKWQPSELVAVDLNVDSITDDVVMLVDIAIIQMMNRQEGNHQ